MGRKNADGFPCGEGKPGNLVSTKDVTRKQLISAVM